MSEYTIPGRRRRAVKQAADAMRAARRVVLTTHLNADGDGAGSQVAVAAWLRANGTRAHIVNPTRFPDLFRFLVPDESWVLEAGTVEAQEACDQADLAVVLDTGEVARIGRVKPMIEHLHTVVVDHHPAGERAIGGISLRDAEACATGELVYDVLQQTGGPWPEAALAGILTDTGSFRFSNSTPRAHRIAADLIDRGVHPEVLYQKVYGESPLRRFRLLEACLPTLEADDGVAWMVVPRAAYEELGSSNEDLEGLVDYPRAVEGVEVALLFRHTPKGTKVSFRATGAVDVNAVAREFGGGGHVKASGALIEGGLDEVMPRVLAATRAAVAKGPDRSEA
jgi:bifunctional oligoribonuclease and PAP phosphatase NrnA